MKYTESIPATMPSGISINIDIQERVTSLKKAQFGQVNKIISESGPKTWARHPLKNFGHLTHLTIIAAEIHPGEEEHKTVPLSALPPSIQEVNIHGFTVHLPKK